MHFYGCMVVTDNVVNFSRQHLCYTHGHQNNMACFCDTERGQACCEMITSNKSLLKLLFSYMAYSQDNSIIKLLLPLNHSPIFNPFVKQDKHHWVIKNNYGSGRLIHVSWQNYSIWSPSLGCSLDRKMYMLHGWQGHGFYD